MTTATGNQAIKATEDFAAQYVIDLNAELKRIGALDEGNGGLTACFLDWEDEGKFICVADTESWLVASDCLQRIQKLPDNLVAGKIYDCDEWQSVWECIGDPDVV